MATAAVTADKISIGNILSRAFSAVGSNPATFFGITFLFGGLPSAVLGYLQTQLRVQEGETGMSLSAQVALSILSAAISLVLAMLVQGALVRATVAYAAGQRASIGECAAIGLRAMVPLIGLAIVSGLGVILGFALLIVPGVILYLIWSVAAPVLVEERRGIFDSLARSRALTKGARLRIFGLQLLILLFLWIVMAILGVAMIATSGGVAGMAQMARAGFPVGVLLLQLVVSTITTTIWSAIQTSLYVELRDWKDGSTPERLADIFA